MTHRCPDVYKTYQRKGEYRPFPTGIPSGGGPVASSWENGNKP
jgi:hypothetical protein